MKNTSLIITIIIAISSCNSPNIRKISSGWDISIIPPSVRLDPVKNKIIDHRFVTLQNTQTIESDILKNNWVFDGNKATIKGARGEYVSFQLVLTNHSDSPIRAINIDMQPFKNGEVQFRNNPELFLEWSVQVKTTSTGYPKASLGKGWYPDALIPIEYIQMDSAEVHRRWTYPLDLPDFHNRIENQQSIIIWVDQYIPFDRENAPPGVYTSLISASIGNKTREIPVDLHVWDFAIPNENRLRASLQHEGFLSNMEDNDALKIYQLFKRNRIGLMDPTYKPDLQITESRNIELGWDDFDQRLKKLFTGEAFTSEYGYEFGPGYGTPIETFILPFNVFGKHGGKGWPDTGTPETERQPENIALYRKVIKEVRDHLTTMYDPEKTEITAYLNGLDESYFPEAWDRMVYYGDIFKNDYPEAHFRIDGSYSEEAMGVVKNSINSWAAHTINYNIDEVRKYQNMGIEDWLYGPMYYESKVNSWVGSSTFIDLPLVNDRAISWASWKYKTYSWISWGVGAGWRHAWYDPETWKDSYKLGAESDAEFTFKKINGNGMLIYSPGIVPNVRGACPSIRLKAMRNGVQEYEYMRLLSELEGTRDKADQTVNSVINMPFGKNSIGNLDVWSADAEKWDQKRIEMGELIHNKQ